MATTITSTMLLDGLRRESSAGWAEFCTRYEPVLLAFAHRSGLREEDARDVVQEALMAFLEAFREGKYDRDRGRLRSWLGGIVLNKIRECRRRHLRDAKQPVDASDATAFLDRVPDDHTLSDMFEEEWQRGIMGECLRVVRGEVDANTFQAFELYALNGWPPGTVAEHCGLSVNAVYLAKTRVLSRLRQLRHEITETW